MASLSSTQANDVLKRVEADGTELVVPQAATNQMKQIQLPGTTGSSFSQQVGASLCLWLCEGCQ